MEWYIATIPTIQAELWDSGPAQEGPLKTAETMESFRLLMEQTG